MSGSTLPYFLAAAAIGGPMLLLEGAQRGIPIPAYVSPAQHAAMAALRTPFSYTFGATFSFTPKRRTDYLDASAMAWLTDVVNFLAPLRPGTKRGTSGFVVPFDFAPTRGDVEQFAARLTAAVAAGVAHGYKVVRSDDREDQTNVLENIARGDFASEAGHTELGAALVGVVRMMFDATPAPNIFGVPDDIWQDRTGDPPAGAMRALGMLAMAMDEQGISVTGKPPDGPTISGGIAHAFGETVDFLVGVPASVGGAVAGAAAAAAFSTTGLMLICGYLVYRAVKA